MVKKSRWFGWTIRTEPDCRSLLLFFLITLFLRGAGEFKKDSRLGGILKSLQNKYIYAMLLVTKLNIRILATVAFMTLLEVKINSFWQRFFIFCWIKKRNLIPEFEVDPFFKEYKPVCFYHQPGCFYIIRILKNKQLRGWSVEKNISIKYFR